MRMKDFWMVRLLDFVFWIFLIATILHVIFLLFIPTPTEWPGQFPYDFKWGWEFWAPFLRHLSLFREHFPIGQFIEIINGAFLTMFIYKMGRDVKEAIENGDGKVASSTYVDWAMGALLSGIIFASSIVSRASIQGAAILMTAIFVFSFVSYYFLYRLRQKLRIEEGKPVAKSDSETYTHE